MFSNLMLLMDLKHPKVLIMNLKQGISPQDKSRIRKLFIMRKFLILEDFNQRLQIMIIIYINKTIIIEWVECLGPHISNSSKDSRGCMRKIRHNITRPLNNRDKYLKGGHLLAHQGRKVRLRKGQLFQNLTWALEELVKEQAEEVAMVNSRRPL